MKPKQIFLLSLPIAFLVVVFGSGWITDATTAQRQTDRKDGSVMIANASVEGTLRVKQGALPIKGRTSMYLEASANDLKQGAIKVRQFNLVFPDAPQAAISGREPKSKNKNGVLGMSVPASERSVRLRYDAKTQTISGEIPVQVHFPQIDEIYPPEINRNDKEQDVAVSRTQRGRIKLEIKLDESPERASARATQRQAARLNGRTSIQVEVEGLGDIPPYRIDVTHIAIIDIGPIFWFEGAQRLCIQPVRIRSSASDASPTGAGLAFGMPGANTQWGKADVVFQQRAFMTVTNSAWKIATPGDEEVSIRASVDVADCIEIFFVQNFNPENSHGGGATWGSGTANAKIISSDGNATFGVDLTHLAHELGHVLNMDHPGAPNGLFNACTNTLMCPSGWHNDNPKRNCTTNALNVSNPLLVFTIKRIGPSPDCNNNGDCGGCP